MVGIGQGNCFQAKSIHDCGSKLLEICLAPSVNDGWILQKLQYVALSTWVAQALTTKHGDLPTFWLPDLSASENVPSQGRVQDIWGTKV